MKKTLGIFLVLGLISCAEQKQKTYIVQVNYMSQSINQTPPSDTITIISYEKPHMRVYDEIPVLVADNRYEPEASYVRSFKILSTK